MAPDPAETQGLDGGSRVRAVLHGAARGVVGAMAMTGELSRSPVTPRPVTAGGPWWEAPAQSIRQAAFPASPNWVRIGQIRV